MISVTHILSNFESLQILRKIPNMDSNFHLDHYFYEDKICISTFNRKNSKLLVSVRCANAGLELLALFSSEFTVVVCVIV